MLRKIYSFLLAGLCLFTLSACKTDLDEVKELDQEGDFFHSEKASAELVFYSPQNEAKDVVGRTPVTFIWNSPIFALQNPESSQKFLEENITITPVIEGSWQLVGTTGVLFDPREDWKFSTRYEFEVLDLGIKYAFETPRVEIEALHAKDLGGNNPLTVLFNQPISLAEAEKITLKTGSFQDIFFSNRGEDGDGGGSSSSGSSSGSFSGGSRKIISQPESVSSQDFSIRYKKIKEQLDGEETERIDESVIEFIPKTEWTEGVSFILTLPQGVVGTEGNLPTLKDKLNNFSTIPRFRVKDFDAPEDVFRSLYLDFSSDVSVHDFFKKISLEPIDAEVWREYAEDKMERSSEDRPQSRFYLDPPGGRWQAEQNYTLKIPADLEDNFGRQLGEDKIFNFQAAFPNQLQSFFFPRSHRVYKSDELPKFFVKHSGEVGPIKLKISRFWPESQSREVNLNWIFSKTRQRIEELDLAEIFPEFFSEGDLAGVFQLELLYDDKRRSLGRLISEFSLVDFSVEMKLAANDTIQISPSTFSDESAPIVPEQMQIITRDCGNTGCRLAFDLARKFTTEFAKPDNFWGVLLTAGDKIGLGSREFQNGFIYGDLPVSVNQGEYQTDLRGVVFTDRPLFQPGDQVNFKSIFRETNFFQKVFPLKTIDPQKTFRYRVEISDSRREKVFEKELKTVGGSLDGSWEIPQDLVFGEYSIELSFLDFDDNYYNSAKASFYVGEYHKPDFLIDGAWGCEQAIWKEKCEAGIQAEYAFGGALAGKHFDYTVSLFGYKSQGWWWQAPGKQDRVILRGEGSLDQNGAFSVPVDFDFELGDEEVDWELMNLDISVQASPSESSSKTVSIPFFLSKEKIELNRLPYFFGAEETEIPFSGTLEDLSGEALEKKFEAELLRRKWVRNDRKNAVGDFAGEWRVVEESVAKIKVSSDERGKFSGKFTRPEDSSEYVLRVKSLDKKNRAALAEQTFYVWTSQRDEFTLRQNPDNKTFVPFAEKDEYRVGEMATVLFPHTEWEIDRAHITIERGKVLETLTPDIENQTASFQVEAWMAPNVIVSIILEGRDEKGSPRVKFGALNLPVFDPAHELDISVRPEKTDYEPREKVKLFLTTKKDGQPVSAELTVAVVDQTLLALRSRAKLGMLFKKFLKELPLGVYTTHTLANFISRADLEDIYENVEKIKALMDGAFGGGGKGDDVKPRGDFRDTAEWIASAQTDQNGEAILEFTLPDNLTLWHIWIAGHTEDNAFGEAESEFRTSLPLLISPITSNIFRFGDESEVGLLIRRNVTSPKSEKVKIKLTLSDDFVESEFEKTISVEEEARIFFPVEVARGDKFAWPLDGKEVTLKFEIEAQESGLSDAVEIERKILPPTISTSAAEFLRVEDAESIAISTDERALKSALTFKVFGTLLDRLQKFVDEAREMNYGCAEQRLSFWTTRILQSNLFQKVGREADPPSQEELRENLKYILDSQDDSGGFNFWNTWRSYNSRPSEWLTANILEFAPEWKTVSFPKNSLNLARNWLNREIHDNCSPENNWHCLSDATRQYGAFVLARDGRLSSQDFDFFLTYTRSTESKVWFLRAANLFKKSQLSPAVKKSVKEFEKEFNQMMRPHDRYAFWEEPTGSRSFYSQNERLTAILFEYWIEKDISSKLHPKIARYLADTDARLSGNTALRILVALQNYDEDLPSESDPTQFEISSPKLDFTDVLKNPLDQKEKTFELKRDENYQFALGSSNKKSFYVDAELHEIFSAKDLAPISHGFWIQREIFELTDTEFEDPIEKLEVGKNYLVRLKIVSSSTHRQVMVSDPIISGAEIVNFDFENVDSSLEEFIKTDSDQCFGWCTPLVSHRESRFDSARFFIDRLSPGTHEIRYVILARIEGKYEALPSKILEMYYPEVMATGAGKEIEIFSK
jgi:alpha-2-macroglobulin